MPRERVFGIARRLVEAGCEEVAFGDTTGMANPRQVREFFERGRAELDVELTAHFHNTRGQGLANALAALEAGVRSFETLVRRAGRLPGAARAPPATSPPRTSCRCCTRWGYDTGIDLERLVACAREAQRGARPAARAATC